MAKFKVKTKNNFCDKLLEKIVRRAKKRPEFIDLNQENGETDYEQARCIMIGNHSGAKGAFTYRAFMDKRFMTWGAHQMCEGFGSRRKYLYHIFYRKKLGYGKLKSFLLSISFGLVSKIIYRSAGIIPVYYNLNIKNTFKYSFECLNKDVSVFIFPENSLDGYKDVIEEFYPGFLMLSQLYYNKYGQDLPIYTHYFCRKSNKLVIGKPMFLQKLKQRFDTMAEIMEHFKQYMNSLYTDIILAKP